jgi:hypothetical protein
MIIARPHRRKPHNVHKTAVRLESSDVGRILFVRRVPPKASCVLLARTMPAASRQVRQPAPLLAPLQHHELGTRDDKAASTCALPLANRWIPLCSSPSHPTQALPLSTTYVTFWGPWVQGLPTVPEPRECRSSASRGVSFIGGWFITSRVRSSCLPHGSPAHVLWASCQTAFMPGLVITCLSKQPPE